MNSTIESLSQPISEEKPCGENLEYDPQFLKMVELYEAREKAGFATSGDGYENKGPDWKGVEKLAEELLTRTRDFRILAYGAVASLHTNGLAGFRNYLELAKVYSQEFWDSVYPVLDADDNNDPLERLNAFEIIGSNHQVLSGLAQATLVEQPGLGKFGLHEVDLAEGSEQPEGQEGVEDIGMIRQVFAAAKPEHIDQIRETVNGSLVLLEEIVGIWAEKTGDAQLTPVIDTVEGGLKRVAMVIEKFSPSSSTDVSADLESGSQAVEAPQGQPLNSTSGAVTSRADVVRILERICEYYATHEPSSPIPLLLRRAQRLVEKSFMEILEDMVPDGVQQAKLVSGRGDEDN